MKRHIAFLLAFCMLLTSFPIGRVHANGAKEVPQGIVFDTSEGALKIGFGDGEPTKAQIDWMRSIESIKINGQYYYKEGSATGEKNYRFEFSEGEKKIIIDNHVLVLPENPIEITAQGYTFYKGVFKNENIKNMADGLTITSIETGQSSTDPKGTYVGVRLKYKYNSNRGGALNYLLKNNVEKVVIDGKTLNRIGSDNFPNLLWYNGIFCTWDKMKDGKAIVENFAANTAHEFKIIMKDGSEVVKREEGYVDKNNEPTPNEKLSQVNTGGMAKGLEITGVGTPEIFGNALNLFSETPREKWQEKYIQNIRYILVDDNGGNDLRPGFTNFFVDAKKNARDIRLFNGKLEFAMEGIKLLNNEAHKIEIGFKDGNTITYTQAGYVAPKEIKFDVKKYIAEQDKNQKPEPGNENTLAKRFQIERIGFTKNSTGNYDYSTPKIFFKNLPPKSNMAESTALENAMKDATFQVNGGKKITNVQGGITRGLEECFEAFSFSPYGGPALGKAIKEAGNDPHIVVTFSDGSVWDNKPNESGHETPVPETGKKDEYPIQNIIFKINGSSPQLELDFGSAQKAKEVGNEIKTIKINGKAYDKSTFGFSMVTDHYISNDEAIAKALYGKSEIKVEITYNDDTTATKTVTITPVEDPNAPKPQPETPKLVTKVDAATGVKAEYMSDVFEEGTELKVEKVDKAKFLETYQNAPKEIDKAGNFTAYDVSFVKNGEKQGTVKNVKLFFPIGDHNKTSVALYQAYADYDEDDQLQTGADKVKHKVEGDYITHSTNSFTTYAITSDKMIKKTDDAAKVSVEYPKGAFKDGTKLKVASVPGGEFVKDNAAVKAVAEKAKTVTAYDISFLLNNAKQQPNRKVEVTLPLGAHDKDSVKVYHYDKSAAAAPELVKDVKIQGDKIVFEADKFSYYFVTSGVKEEPGDTRKLNERFQIKDVKAEKNYAGSDALKISLKNMKSDDRDGQKAFADAIKEAKFFVNGGEAIENVTVYWTMVTDNFEVATYEGGGEALLNAVVAAGENPHIKVVFSDESEWENRKAGDTPAKTDNFDLTDKLPNGEYTIHFTPTEEGKTKELPMVSGIIGNRAKLVVKDGKMMLSLRAGKLADQILDLGMKIDGQFKSGEKTTEGLKQDQAIYTCEVKDLHQIQKLAVLVKAMHGSADQIGQFDKYTKADLHFKAPIKKGFKGYDDPTDPEAQKKRNDENLTLKLLAAGVKDLNNDGKLSPDELYKATGRLDLSGEKIAKTPDISMLKDLGPGVAGIELSSNDITEIPEGLFDKMTGLTHINIYGNKIKTLPKGIFDNNEDLSTLWMSGNKLTDLDKDLLAKNTKIREIDLSNNGIKKLPEGLLKGASRLETFYASENKLTSLDGVLSGKYKWLRIINVNGNELRSLPEAFGNHKALEELRANNNKLKALPKAMDQLKRLVILDLENNEIESLPESLWLRMADNANEYATKNPNLVVKGNLLKAIPFDKIAEKASGQRVRFNKFDVSCNYLKSTLTDAELATIKTAGVTIKDTHDNFYQPQRSAINAQVNYADGKVKVSQDLDLLQMFYWNIGDINDWKFFKSPDEYKAFVENTIYKKYGIVTGNDRLGIAQVLDKTGWDWKIQNIIEKIDGDKATVVYNGFVKNKGHNDVDSEIDPVDSLNPVIEAALDPGANYKLTRRLMLTKSTFVTEFSYSVDFKTPETAVDEDLAKAKDALRAAIAAAEGKLKDGKDYTDATKKAVSEQLAAAKEALKGNDAEAMNTAKAALENAVKALEEKPAVSGEDAKLKKAKDALTKAIEAAEAKLKDGKDYTDATKKAVSEQLTAAKEALKGNDADAMNKAKAALENAVKALEEKPAVSGEDAKLKEAKDALTKAIEAAEAKLKDGKDYTDATKKAVSEQLTAAKKALKGNDAEAMNKAKAALENAVKALEEKPAVSGEDAKLKKAKDALTKAIAAAEAKLKDGKTYTAETKAAVEKAIAQAEKDLAGSDKEAINKAKDVLEKAVAGLKEAQKPTPQPQPQPKPNPQPKPTPKPSNENKNRPGGSYSGNASNKSGSNTQSTPSKPQESKPVEKPKTTETKANFTLNVPKEAFVKGYPDGSFKPNQQVVRSELATMLARFVSVSGDLQKALTDIRPTDWYFDSFKTLINAGIITGYGDGTYRPSDGVTRAQAVTMIARIKGLQPKQGGFKDVPANAWYAGYAGAAQEAGIVVGYEDGSFGGDCVITRAEIIAMINRAFNIPKKESRKAFSDLPENHWAYEDIQKAAN